METRDAIVGVPQNTVQWDCPGTNISITERKIWTDVRDHLVSIGVNANPNRVPQGTAPFDDYDARSLGDPDQLAAGNYFPNSHILRIVCLRPLTIVAVPVWKPRNAGGEWCAKTTIPYHDDIKLVPTDARSRPEELKPGLDGVRRIRTSWGSLVFTHRGDDWIVTAEPSS